MIYYKNKTLDIKKFQIVTNICNFYINVIRMH